MPQFFSDVRGEGSYEHHEVFEYLTVAALHLCEFSYANHECRDAGVVREGLDVVGYLLDKLVNALQLLRCCLVVVRQELVVAAVEESPEFLKEAMATVDAVGVPWFRLLDRTKEHLVEAKRVGTVFLNNHVGVDNIEHRLRHLFYCPSADVLPVFEYEFRILVFRSPSLERLDVELVVVDDVHIDVDRCNLIVALKSEGNEGWMVLAFLVDTIDEVGAALYHSLVNEFLEWLVGARVAAVVKEFVPEARVYEVTGSVLGTTDV